MYTNLLHLYIAHSLPISMEGGRGKKEARRKKTNGHRSDTKDVYISNPLLGRKALPLACSPYSCQKVKHCFTLIVYNDVHYHISSLLSSSKTERGTNRVDRCTERRQISEKRYITSERKEEENRRERTSYIDYLYISSLLCNPVLRRTGGTKLVTIQSTAGIIEKSYNFWSKTLFIVLTT